MLFAGVLCLFGTVSCSKPKGALEIAKVTGTVDYLGKPLSGVEVFFHPEHGPLISSGKTDDSGRFVLTTLKPNDGAYVGLNRVSLTKSGLFYAHKDGRPISAEEELKIPSLKRIEIQTRYNLIRKTVGNSKFSNPNTSPLKFDVRSGTKNEFQIEVTD